MCQRCGAKEPQRRLSYTGGNSATHDVMRPNSYTIRPQVIRAYTYYKLWLYREIFLAFSQCLIWKMQGSRAYRFDREFTHPNRMLLYAIANAGILVIGVLVGLVVPVLCIAYCAGYVNLPTRPRVLAPQQSWPHANQRTIVVRMRRMLFKVTSRLNSVRSCFSRRLVRSRLSHISHPSPGSERRFGRRNVESVVYSWKPR